MFSIQITTFEHTCPTFWTNLFIIHLVSEKIALNYSVVIYSHTTSRSKRMEISFWCLLSITTICNLFSVNNSQRPSCAHPHLAEFNIWNHQPEVVPFWLISQSVAWLTSTNIPLFGLGSWWWIVPILEQFRPCLLLSLRILFLFVVFLANGGAVSSGHADRWTVKKLKKKRKRNGLVTSEHHVRHVSRVHSAKLRPKRNMTELTWIDWTRTNKRAVGHEALSIFGLFLVLGICRFFWLLRNGSAKALRILRLKLCGISWMVFPRQLRSLHQEPRTLVNILH